VQQLWRVDVPQMAFEHSGVLNAMLGTAAFHILTLKPDDDPTTRIAQLDSSTAQPVFVSAILISLYAKFRAK